MNKSPQFRWPRRRFVLLGLAILVLTGGLLWGIAWYLSPKDIVDAAWNGDIKSVRRFLDQGVSANTVIEPKGTPLLFAKNAAVADLLIARGADVNRVYGTVSEIGGRRLVFGTTSLHMAAKDGRADVAAVLLNHGADSNALALLGFTPLFEAAGSDHKDVAELLLSAKADVNAKCSTGDTPLHLAALAGHRDMVELLLTKGADVNATDNQGNTPLHDAVEKGHNDVAQLIRQHGAHE